MAERAFLVTLRGSQMDGSIYWAESPGAARYDYLLDAQDAGFRGITFGMINVRRSPRHDAVPEPMRRGVGVEHADRWLAEHAAVERWNAEVAVGALVDVRLDGGGVRRTTTRSAAHFTESGHAVVWLDGIVGCYALTHVAPVVAHG